MTPLSTAASGTWSVEFQLASLPISVTVWCVAASSRL